MAPPRTTVDMKPEFCSCRASLRWSLELGIDVKPRRALEALLMWEQMLASSTSDMLATGKAGQTSNVVRNQPLVSRV